MTNPRQIAMILKNNVKSAKKVGEKLRIVKKNTYLWKRDFGVHKNFFY